MIQISETEKESVFASTYFGLFTWPVIFSHHEKRWKFARQTVCPDGYSGAAIYILI